MLIAADPAARVATNCILYNYYVLTGMNRSGKVILYSRQHCTAHTESASSIAKAAQRVPGQGIGRQRETNLGGKLDDAHVHSVVGDGQS